mmetsp:Transcript_61732/g.74282  ORF Transcript_61732/g.74282 Transcript_61732/m.74282 type:complete len:214 (-) Transcript_61732:364-1005(-)
MVLVLHFRSPNEISKYISGISSFPKALFILAKSPPFTAVIRATPKGGVYAFRILQNGSNLINIRLGSTIIDVNDSSTTFTILFVIALAFAMATIPVKSKSNFGGFINANCTASTQGITSVSGFITNCIRPSRVMLAIPKDGRVLCFILMLQLPVHTTSMLKVHCFPPALSSSTTMLSSIMGVEPMSTLVKCIPIPFKVGSTASRIFSLSAIFR